MNTINMIYDASSNKQFLIQNSADSRIYLVESKLDNDWFLTKPLIYSPLGYVADGSFIILKGDEALWLSL